MALDQEAWITIANNLSEGSLLKLHGALTSVATNDPQEFTAHPDFQIQADIIEKELAKREVSYQPISLPL